MNKRINGMMTKRIQCDLTASEWMLYTDTRAGLAQKSAQAALDMNHAVNTILNSGEPRQTAEPAILRMFEPFDYLGALDSEPLAVLGLILDAFYS